MPTHYYSSLPSHYGAGSVLELEVSQLEFDDDLVEMAFRLVDDGCQPTTPHSSLPSRPCGEQLSVWARVLEARDWRMVD